MLSAAACPSCLYLWLVLFKDTVTSRFPEDAQADYLILALLELLLCLLEFLLLLLPSVCVVLLSGPVGGLLLLQLLLCGLQDCTLLVQLFCKSLSNLRTGTQGCIRQQQLAPPMPRTLLAPPMAAYMWSPGCVHNTSERPVASAMPSNRRQLLSCRHQGLSSELQVIGSPEARYPIVPATQQLLSTKQQTRAH